MLTDAQKRDFGQIFYFPGPRKQPLELHFRLKRQQRTRSFSGLVQPGADLVAICHRKRSKDAFSSICVRFLVDFGQILIIFEGLLMLLFRIPSPFIHDIDGPTILAPIQIMWPGGVRASRLNKNIGTLLRRPETEFGRGPPGGVGFNPSSGA